MSVFKTLHFKYSSYKHYHAQSWSQQPRAAPENTFPSQENIFFPPNLQINIDNFVPQSRSAAQPPTVRRQPRWTSKYHKPTLAGLYFRSSFRVKSLSQDTVSKRTLCLSVAASALKTVLKHALYLTYEAFFVENNSTQIEAEQIAI